MKFSVVRRVSRIIDCGQIGWREILIKIVCCYGGGNVLVADCCFDIEACRKNKRKKIKEKSKRAFTRSASLGRTVVRFLRIHNDLYNVTRLNFCFFYMHLVAEQFATEEPPLFRRLEALLALRNSKLQDKKTIIGRKKTNDRNNKIVCSYLQFLLRNSNGVFTVNGQFNVPQGRRQSKLQSQFSPTIYRF